MGFVRFTQPCRASRVSQWLPPDALLRVHNYVIAGLMRLRRYDQAQAALARLGPFFGDDKQYETYPKIYGGRKGNMVPFNLHLLRSELPHFTGRTKQTIELLFTLLGFYQSEPCFSLRLDCSFADSLPCQSKCLRCKRSPSRRTRLPVRTCLAVDCTSDRSICAELATVRDRTKAIRIRLAGFHLHEPDFVTGASAICQLPCAIGTATRVSVDLQRRSCCKGWCRSTLRTARCTRSWAASICSSATFPARSRPTNPPRSWPANPRPRTASTPNSTGACALAVFYPVTCLVWCGRGAIAIARNDFTGALEIFTPLVKLAPGNDVVVRSLRHILAVVAVS